MSDENFENRFEEIIEIETVDLDWSSGKKRLKNSIFMFDERLSDNEDEIVKELNVFLKGLQELCSFYNKHRNLTTDVCLQYSFAAFGDYVIIRAENYEPMAFSMKGLKYKKEIKRETLLILDQIKDGKKPMPSFIQLKH